FTHTKVRSLLRDRDGDWCLECEVAAAGGSAPSRRTVRADLVVLAAGSLGSTEILLRSRQRGLALSDRLGRQFSGNGDIIAFGWGGRLPVAAGGGGHPPQIEAGVGGPRSRPPENVHGARPRQGLPLQEGRPPPALAPAPPVVFLPTRRALGAPTHVSS